MGNGSYINRGCEAIVRSTVNILSDAFPGSELFLSSFGGNDSYRDAETETDNRITHVPHKDTWFKRFDLDWWRFRVFHRRSELWQQGSSFRTQFINALSSDCVLQIGGDNYSLEYGNPSFHMELDNVLHATGVPLVLWGASVGPFSSDKEIEQAMSKHLKQFDLILARESETLKYLSAIGVTDNVKLVADPAFVLPTKKPELSEKLARFLDNSPIGINLSPMIGNYRANDSHAWPALACQCLETLVNSGLGPVLLVPHVTLDGNDDHAFMDEIHHNLHDKKDYVEIVPNNLCAEEYKWIIAKTRAFIGARTHATIAALSTQTPTISIGYSLKARGINKDIFGHLDWLLPIEDMTPSSLLRKTEDLLSKREEVRAHLQIAMPNIVTRAKEAGQHLASLFEQREVKL